MKRAEAKRLRDDAKNRGDKTYTTGEPCKHGHISEKYTSTGGCVACALASAKKRADNNPEQITAYLKQWYRENKEKHAMTRSAWKAKNPEKVKTSNKKYRDRSKDKSAAYYAMRMTQTEFVKAKNKYNSEWRKRNKGLCVAYVNFRRTAKIQRTPVWLTEDDKWMICEAYLLARLRTKLTGVAWHVDHVIPLRGETVSGLHVPSNLQVIPQVENLRKGNRYAPREKHLQRGVSQERQG